MRDCFFGLARTDLDFWRFRCTQYHAWQFVCLGGYTAASLTAFAMHHALDKTPVLFLVLLLAAVVVGVLMGLLLEVVLLRYFQKKDPVIQLLVTFAASVIFEDFQNWYGDHHPIRRVKSFPAWERLNSLMSLTPYTKWLSSPA
jgi:branched-subunit amino acid ABC-type transport system permease component